MFLLKQNAVENYLLTRELNTVFCKYWRSEDKMTKFFLELLLNCKLSLGLPQLIIPLGSCCFSDGAI